MRMPISRVAPCLLAVVTRTFMSASSLHCVSLQCVLQGLQVEPRDHRDQRSLAYRPSGPHTESRSAAPATATDATGGTLAQRPAAARSGGTHDVRRDPLVLTRF